MDMWTTRYWQSFGRLVQELNGCTEHAGQYEYVHLSWIWLHLLVLRQLCDIRNRHIEVLSRVDELIIGAISCDVVDLVTYTESEYTCN